MAGESGCRSQSRTAWRLVTIEVAAEDATLSYRLDRNKLRQIRLRRPVSVAHQPRRRGPGQAVEPLLAADGGRGGDAPIGTPCDALLAGTIGWCRLPSRGFTAGQTTKPLAKGAGQAGNNRAVRGWRLYASRACNYRPSWRAGFNFVELWRAPVCCRLDMSRGRCMGLISNFFICPHPPG
jgi:hypothetical protein